MSDRERLAELLAAHQSEQLWKAGGWAGDTACSCGWRMAIWSRKDFPATHRAHVADVLAQMLAEARAETLRPIRETLANHPDACDRYTEEDVISCGWKGAVIGVRAALAAAEPDAGERATMPRASCRCPDDCDCDGRFACEERAGNTEHRCELAVGHMGWHSAGAHRWAGERDA